jgi:putative PIN family toxin of toxin-antitoxin system
VRVFLDTNVLVSAFTARGLCEHLFRYLVTEHEVMTGAVNLEELQGVLVARFHASDVHIRLVESLLQDQVIVPRPPAPSSLPLRDPDDAWVLASAVEGSADMLVTGDSDLLVLAAQSPLPILTPRAAWERLRQGA